MPIRISLGLRVALATCSGVLFALLATNQAAAVTVTNNDQRAYQVEVIVKSSRRQHELATGSSMTDFCKTGCVLRLDGNPDNDYALEGNERVSIEDGLVYYDGEEVPPKSEAGEPAQ